MHSFSDSEIAAYLEEDLEATRASALEAVSVEDTSLQQRIQQIRQQMNDGEHSLGAIWRQHNLSCPGRKTLGGYLLGILPDAQSLFIRSHIETRGCLTCQANLDDLEQQQTETQDTLAARATRYFHSSIGHLSQQSDNEK